MRAQYEPTATKWLSFPHIACALGENSPGIAKTVAHGLISARDGSAVPIHLLNNPMLKHLTTGSLASVVHCLFDDPVLFDALKA